MGSYGKIFKIIRESKNMSLKEVAGDFVTPAQLSRFENGKSNLSVDTFFHCLRRMNMVEGEFSTLYQSYFQIDNLFSSEEFVRAVYSHNAQYMDNKILYHQAEYEKDGRQFDRVMVAAFHIFKQQWCDPDYDVSEDEKAILSDYLMSIDDWGKFELWIFGNCSRGLPSKMLEVLGMEVLNRTKFYMDIAENRDNVYKVLINISSSLLDRGEELATIRFLKILDSVNIMEKNMRDRLLLKLLKARLSYMNGNDGGLEIMKECLYIAKFLDCFDLIHQINKEIEKVTDM